MGWATHVPQGPRQRAATAKAGATPNPGPSPDRALQLPRVKPKSLVIVHQRVTVKAARALHTPPITLGECTRQEVRPAPSPGGGGDTDRLVGDLSEVDTR